VSTTAPPAEQADRATIAVAQRVGRAAENPGLKRAGRIAGYAGAAAILAVFVFGTAMVATMLRWYFVAAGVLALAGLPWVVDRLGRGRAWARIPAVTLSTVVVSILALLGADVLWASAGLGRPSPAAGLVVAGVVVAGVAYAYLRWLGKAPPRHHEAWAASESVVALALVVLTGGGLPQIGLVVTGVAAGFAVWLYLDRPVGPDVKRPLWWALLLVGVAIVAAPLLVEAIQGGRLSPVLLLAAAVVAAVAGINGLWLRRGPDGRSHARWAAGIAVVVGVAIPCLIVAFLRVTSTAPAPPQERAIPAAAVTGPVSQAAIDHRPILLFDSDERFRTPLDVDGMLRSGDVELCPQGNGLLADCRTLSSAADLRNGFGNLRFDSQQIQDAGLATTIYAHQVPDRLHPGWTDIDYWWYLPDNPADTARGAMCGAGLLIAEITCFDHQSDWEGVTVVVDRDEQPVAVHYAAHSHVVDVPWTTLQAALTGPALRRFADRPDAAARPLVFVARGTHAAYPLPCSTAVCSGDEVFEDNSHDGAHGWPEGVPCSNDGCVSAFPSTAGGARRASWNAFDGHWGSAICVAGVYCARSNAPRAPGNQGRYRRPWCYDFQVTTDLRRPHPAKPAACR
jgi:hypothetical protein